MPSSRHIIRESPYFSESEFPGAVLDCMHPRIITLLTTIRAEAETPMYPSPIPRAHVRHDKSGSRHSTHNGERLSDATDFFMSWPDLALVLPVIYNQPTTGGVGIYTDMIYSGADAGEWAMIHLDTRPDSLEWVAWRDSLSDPLHYEYAVNDLDKYERILRQRSPLFDYMD